MSRSADIRARLLPTLGRWWPVLLVTLYGVIRLWPVPAGQMPLSADHTVHLTRAFLVAQELADGHLRGWSSVWFFGTPVGELYPVLGDLLIVALRALSLGLLSWPTAYALGFTVVFLSQGWVLLRAGRAMGWGELPGVVAAFLALSDIGSYREGGWIYTVFYGVWPQALATSLTWWGFAELARACDSDDPMKWRRALVISAVAMGAALLAHPVSMLTIAVGGPIGVLVMGMGDRARLRRSAVTGLLAAALAGLLAAWWLLPMLSHRGWMASYGWLWLPLHTMLEQVGKGHWAQSMPAVIGHTITAGLLIVAIGGRRAARFFGAAALVLWLLAARDVPWLLRLDLVSEGFAHVQYQRFITAAKPGLFLMAGAVFGLLLQAARKAWVDPKVLGKASLGRPMAVGALGVAVGLGGWMASAQSDERSKLERLPLPVAPIQRTRAPDRPALDQAHAELSDWLAEQWKSRDRFWRTSVRDQRNIHWFMDVPVFAEGVPLLKQGFTPGDNFVHKPEAGTPAILDLAQVRYEIRRGQRTPPNTVISFGPVHVVERPGWEQTSIAHLQGPGQVEVLQDAIDDGLVRVRLSGTEGPTRLVFGIAGFPRWTLHGPGGEIEWVEAPIVGEGPDATLQQRRAGELRGGKAHGDDGTEPTLIAAQVRDGEYTLRYERWRGLDIAALLASLLGLLACISFWGRPKKLALRQRTVDTIRTRLGVLGHPLVLLALALSVILWGGVERHRGLAAEADDAVGWVAAGHARTVRGMRPGFLKTDMLIVPAMVVTSHGPDPATLELRDVRLGDTLTGWVGLDDDDTKQRAAGSRRVEIGAMAPDGTSVTLFDRRLMHKPGSVPLRLTTGELAGQSVLLRVLVHSEGKDPPGIGFDLDVGAPPS